MNDKKKKKSQLIQELNQLRNLLSDSNIEYKSLDDLLVSSYHNELDFGSIVTHVLDQSLIGIFILDNEFNIVWANQAIEKFFGIEIEEIIGLDKRKLIVDRIMHIFEDPIPFSDKILATYDNNTYLEIFKCHVLHSNNLDDRWLEHMSEPIESGRYIGGRIELYRDISDQILLEEELKEKANQLELAQRIANMGFLDWNLNTNEMIWDDQAYNLFGVNKDEQVADLDLTYELAHPDDLDIINKDINLAITGKKGYSLDHRIVRPDGTVIWVQAKGETILDNDGNPARLLGTVVDISARKLIENEIIQYQKDLKRLSNQLITAQEDERKEISFALHDDIGQSLSAIGMNLQLIQQNISLEDYRNINNKISDSKNLIEEIINKVRDLSRSLRPALLDNLGLIPALRWSINQYVNRTDIDIDFIVIDFEYELPIHTELLLYRIVQEGLANISKHSQADNVIIRLKQSESELSLSIEDDGIGFDYTNHLFVDKQYGTGLLGINERVLALGGSFSITSKSGEGFCINIKIPIGANS